MHESLLPPEVILLPSEADEAARDALQEGAGPDQVVAAHPEVSRCWAQLAERAWAAGDTIVAYAFARVGYHRGLDALRKAGWRGHNPVPWSHEPNQGFLRCVALLAEAAAQIQEHDETARLRQFLTMLDPHAAAAIERSGSMSGPAGS